MVTASHDADGKITGFLWVAMDVTARQPAELELKKSRESLDS